MSVCPQHPADPGTGAPALAVSCCRLRDHAGECHRHFSSVIGHGLHTTVLRSSGRALECTEGLDLDLAADAPPEPQGATAAARLRER